MGLIASEGDLEHALAPLVPTMNLSETEETWYRIERALSQFQALTKEGATKVPTYVARVRDLSPCIVRSVCFCFLTRSFFLSARAYRARPAMC